MLEKSLFSNDKRQEQIMNRKLKDSAYKALVHPVPVYARVVWDPHIAGTIKDIEKVQRRSSMGPE